MLVNARMLDLPVWPLQPRVYADWKLAAATCERLWQEDGERRKALGADAIGALAAATERVVMSAACLGPRR